MPTPDLDTIFNWRGKTVRDPDGDKVGKLGDVYLDEATDQPAYAGVHTGLFGLKESVVPLDALQEDGDDLIVAYDAATVRDAPKVDPDDGLDPEEEERLARHYGGAGPGVDRTVDDDVERGDLGREGAEADLEAADRGDGVASTGRAEGGMVRSEEEVTTSRGDLRPAERVRIRKVLVTENMKKTVPVQREEIRLETEPAPRGDTVERVED
jgi:sporulation protein YlmC with PRC-barrel domain